MGIGADDGDLIQVALPDARVVTVRQVAHLVEGVVHQQAAHSVSGDPVGRCRRDAVLDDVPALGAVAVDAHKPVDHRQFRLDLLRHEEEVEVHPRRAGIVYPLLVVTIPVDQRRSHEDVLRRKRDHDAVVVLHARSRDDVVVRIAECIDEPDIHRHAALVHDP